LLAQRESESIAGVKSESVTFSEFAERWLTEYAAAHVKPRTLDDYKLAVSFHLSPFFGKLTLRDLSPERIDAFKAQKLREGKPPATINKLLTILGSILKRAVVWRYVRENPVQYVERVKQVRPEMDYLTPDEIRRLLEASDDEYRPLFATAILTGARQGEILALKWSDYDPVRRVLFIRRAFHPVYGFTEPKSAAGRRAINVSPELAAILEDHRVRTCGEVDDLIFANGAGNPIDGTNLLRQRFHPTLARAGLRRIRFHDLRHTNVALRIAVGENMKSIQAQSGHASITTTLDRYGHLLPQASEGSAERLDALIFDSNVVTFPAVKTASQD